MRCILVIWMIALIIRYFSDDDEAFTLQAEIVELKDKPSHPIGTIAVDAFGNKKEYEDKGYSSQSSDLRLEGKI